MTVERAVQMVPTRESSGFVGMVTGFAVFLCESRRPELDTA
jgi:hypothetical protein